MKSLYGLAAFATAISGTAIAQESPQKEDRLKIEIVEGGAAVPRDLIDQLLNDANEANSRQKPLIDRTMRRTLGALAERAGGEETSWRIGVMAAPVDPVLRVHLDLPEDAGLLVSKVVEGSPAAMAGIHENDIIVAAGDRKIDRLETLQEVVRQTAKDDKPLTLSVMQKGKLHQITVKRMPPPMAPDARMAGQDKRPAGDMMPMMQQQNRRFEEMGGVMRKMNSRLEQQQKQIDMLENKLREIGQQKGEQRRKDDRPAQGRPDAPE